MGVPVIGTIARKKKTLDKLMEKVQNVCEKKNTPKPKKILYKSYIEQCVEKLTGYVEKNLPESKQNFCKMDMLKIIDGNKKIINKIEKNFNIDLTKNEELKKIKNEIKDILEFNGIKQENVKDELISSVIFMSENVYNDVVELENKEYNNRDRK